MKNTIYTFLLLLGTISIQAQKIDTDKLLIRAYDALNKELNNEKAITLAKTGIATDPNYTDFYIVAGRAYMNNNQRDSAKVYFEHVISTKPEYKEAFSYLTKMEIQSKNLNEAATTIDKALQLYPEDLDFSILKLDIIGLQNPKDDDEALKYLSELVKKNPNNTDLKQRFTQLNSKTSSDRIGVNYSYTHFSRESVGPWQITGLQYIRERKNLTLIGRVNYADRQSDGNSIASGTQYELESYVQHNQKSYSYASASFSDAIVFPKLKLSYSYFRNFNKGWEADLGTRYTKAADDEIYTTVAGIGKYVGSYWLNLKSYLQFSENDVNPSVTATARYYFNTKYDYATVLLGYGSSPDERVSLVDLEQRITLRSYRVGAGYYKLFNEHYVTGVLATFNNQEYTANLTQNELEVFVTLQYKF